MLTMWQWCTRRSIRALRVPSMSFYHRSPNRTKESRMGKHRIRRQRDLLKLLEPSPVLTPEILKSVVPLLATLLLEVVEAEAQRVAERVTVEARDDG